MLFYIFIGVLIIQRILEVRLAKRNYDAAIASGAIELGKEHYKWMWTLHTLFFCSLLLEYTYTKSQISVWSLIPFLLFVLAQVLRIWAISSLGTYWNTRILIIPNSKLEVKGPYRWIRHPNYLAVIIEIACIPLIFGLYITASIFTLLNAFILIQRIRIEEQGLAQHTTYLEHMQNTPRLIPRRRGKL